MTKILKLQHSEKGTIIGDRKSSIRTGKGTIMGHEKGQIVEHYSVKITEIHSLDKNFLQIKLSTKELLSRNFFQ